MCRVYLELLSDKPEDTQQTIALVLEELDRMAKIVDALELLAEAERADFVRAEPIDLELFAHELIAGASTLAPRDWKLADAAAGVLMADQERLTEAVMHLARNAVEHTLEGDTIAIGTALDEDEDEARLWVRDAGVGVPESEREHIFDRFARGREAHRRYRGSGLGLAVVKAVAEAHGGRVELESQLHSGSTFTIVLPRRSGGLARLPAS